jgi:hypothetical protein
MNLDEIVCGGVGGGVELEDDVGVAKQRQSLWGQRQGCIFLFAAKPFSHGWYYQPRLKGMCAGAGEPPFWSCNARVLALNKSPAKSRVYLKIFPLSSVVSPKPRSTFPSLLPSARVPRISPVPPISPAITRITTALRVVSHSTAAAPLSATSPGIPSPRRSRQPTRFTIDTASAREVLELGKNPTKIHFPSLLIFPRISPNFLNFFSFSFPFSYFLSFPSLFFFPPFFILLSSFFGPRA